MHDNPAYWDSYAGHELDAAVIDPNDRRGHKNNYIAELRNAAVREMLPDNNRACTILDFGCGTGGLISKLADDYPKILGIDISLGLLRRCKDRHADRRSDVAQFDGLNIPLASESVDAVTTYIVLMYSTDGVLTHLLQEMSRILKPGGCLIVMEQFRRRDKMITKEGKLHRSVNGFLNLARNANLTSKSVTVCRYGHFPALYAIRYGLVPRRWFGLLRSIERGFGRIFGVLPWDYSDVRIVLGKSPT